MNILIVTDEGKLLGFAHRLSQEGNKVKVLCRKRSLESHKGLFDVTTDLMASIQEAKFVISDVVAWEYLEKRAKYYNRPVLGLSSVADVGNNDAVKQYSLLQNLQIPVPESRVFDDVSDAFAGILDWNMSKTIIKYGDRQFRCDYKDWLSWGIMQVPVGEKILFQRMVLGESVNIVGWFDSLDWLNAFGIAPKTTINYHHNAIAPVSEKLVDRVMKPLGDFLRSIEYQGPVHIDAVVNKLSAYVQRMYIGFQFPLDNTILEFVQDDLGEFLFGLAFPRRFPARRTKDFVGTVTCLCVGEDLRGAPVIGVNDERLKHLVFHDVSKQDNDFQLANGSYEVFTATAHGKDMAEVSQRVYSTVESVKFPEKHYDDRLNSTYSPLFEKLKNWGYLGVT